MENIRPLNDDLKKKAKDELNEVENRVPEDIEALRSWISKQPHLKAITDDQFLVSFLRGCKFSLEKAKSKIDYFYTIKTILPEIFNNRKIDDDTLDLCRSGAYIRLPEPLGVDGPRIHINGFPRLDQNRFDITDLLRYMCILIEMNICQDDNSVISGYLEITDLSKITLSFLSKIDVVLVKKVITFAEKASPMRLKGVHVINVAKEAQPISFLIRSLMSPKLKERFFIHKSLDELYEHIPKKYLPIEYGGTNGSIPDIQVETEKKLKDFNDYLIDDENYRVNEKLRFGKKVDSNTLFGIEGSFRKLEID